MVLHHVTQSTGVVVVTGPFFNPELFGQGYLYVVDVTVVPKGFNDRVPKAQGLDVLDHFLTQVVVNPEDLVFLKRLGKFIV